MSAPTAALLARDPFSGPDAEVVAAPQELSAVTIVATTAITAASSVSRRRRMVAALGLPGDRRREAGWRGGGA
jgi:hypothetical protein